MCEGVERHLWSSDSRPAYRGICALHSSKPVPQCTAVRAEGCGLLTGQVRSGQVWEHAPEQRVAASTFRRYSRGLRLEESEVDRGVRSEGPLYQAHPPAVALDVRGVTIPIADPPINCDPPLFVETQAVVNWMKWCKAAAICDVHAELLNAGGNAVLMLHAVLCSA